MVKVSVSGNNKNTYNLLNRLKSINVYDILNKYGEQGVSRLKQATPTDTGKTADSWYYKIEKKGDVYNLIFCNSNVKDGVNIAFVIQHGHITTRGTWVEGQDYINPSLSPIFNNIKESIWKEMSE